jgi:hypothetical protein
MKYDTINVPLAAGSTQTKINFPDQPNIRDAQIYGVELCFTDKTFFGGNCINYDGVNNVVANAYITLYFDGCEAIHQLPISEIAPIISGNTNATNTIGGTVNGILGNNPKKIIWTKSYITLGVPSTPTADTNFVLGVYYKI